MGGSEGSGASYLFQLHGVTFSLQGCSCLGSNPKYLDASPMCTHIGAYPCTLKPSTLGHAHRPTMLRHPTSMKEP